MGVVGTGRYQLPFSAGEPLLRVFLPVFASPIHMLSVLQHRAWSVRGFKAGAVGSLERGTVRFDVVGPAQKAPLLFLAEPPAVLHPSNPPVGLSSIPLWGWVCCFNRPRRVHIGFFLVCEREAG